MYLTNFKMAKQKLTTSNFRRFHSIILKSYLLTYLLTMFAVKSSFQHISSSFMHASNRFGFLQLAL